MSKKSAKHKKAATAREASTPKPAKTPKPSPFGSGPRTTRTWVERQLLRAQRACKQIGNLSKSIASGKPPVFGEVVVTTAGLDEAFTFVAAVEAQLGLLPADWKPKRAQVNRSGIEIGSTIGVKDDSRKDPVFQFIDADLYEMAQVVASDGAQNWLVKCTDGIIRTIRKMMVEAVFAEGETSEGTDQEVAEPDEGELDDSDDDTDESI